jgi:protocatechuate 3,4-dioxygenase beta subunit
LIEPGMPGTRLNLSGRVLSASCSPVAHALLDFWQADASGHYDDSGFRLRGHLFSNDQGEFALETVVPGLYPGRTQHIHVKVQAPGSPVLTTQLYFPGQARNQQDSIFDPRLLMDVRDDPGGKTATFNFVLASG